MELENNQQSRKQKKSPAITPEQRQEFYRLRYTEGQMVKTIAEKFGVPRIPVHIVDVVLGFWHLNLTIALFYGKHGFKQYPVTLLYILPK